MRIDLIPYAMRSLYMASPAVLSFIILPNYMAECIVLAINVVKALALMRWFCHKGQLKESLLSIHATKPPPISQIT